MRAWWLCCLGCLWGLGPQLVPQAGETVDAATRRLLPSARHSGGVGDLWFTPVVNLQTGGGGLDLFDPLQLSMHGWSWSQLHIQWGDVELTDPARPGQALLELPYEAWQAVRLNSLWSALPGFALTVLPPAAPALSLTQQPTPAAVQARGGLAWGATLDGDLWTPLHAFDRDPAFGYGAPRQRRSMRGAQEARLQLDGQLGQLQGRLFGEVLRHQHHYLTLTPLETATRQTLLVAGRGQGVLPWEAIAAWQHQGRDFAGAQYRWPQALTATTDSQSGVLQLASETHWQDAAALRLSLGGGYRWDGAERHSEQPLRIDLLDQWLWLQRPQAAVTNRLRAQRRARLQAHLDWQLNAWWRLDTRLSYRVLKNDYAKLSSLQQDISLAQQPLASSHLRLAGPSRQVWHDWRSDAWFTPNWGSWHAEVLAGVDATRAAFASQVAALAYVSPALGAQLRWDCSRQGDQLFVLLRREPWVLNSMVSDFLDTAQPSGPILGVQGVLPPRQLAHNGGTASAYWGNTGGLYHDRAALLRRPQNDSFVFGYRSRLLGPWRLALQSVARRLVDRFNVALAVPGAPPASWRRQSVFDPGNDGRSGPSGALLAVPELTAAQRQQARFVLSNDPVTSSYLGFEFNVATENTRYWFVNIGGAAYMINGHAPFGIFADRNDPGVLDEAAAQPAALLHPYGRYDADRSYALKILAAVLPLPNLTLGLVARYHDGEPASRFFAVQEVTPPTVVMAIKRGETRFTFDMTWDVRLRYAWSLPLPSSWEAAPQVALSLDIFNLLNSATEIFEDVRTGPSFREALEVVPGRAMLLNLEVGML